MKSLGELLKKARESQHFTQCEVAEELRVARSTVSNWECGRAEPDLRTLHHLSGFLQYDLLGEHREDTADQEENIRKLRLNLSDSPVFEVISSENACVFSDFTINLQVNGSDSHGNTILLMCRSASVTLTWRSPGNTLTTPTQSANRPTKSCQRYSFDLHQRFVHSFTPLWTRAWTKCGQTPFSAQKRNSLISERVP